MTPLAHRAPGVVTAAMIETGHDVEIMNPDLVICNLDAGAKINMEMTVGTGKGYVPAFQNKTADRLFCYFTKMASAS